MPRVVGGSWGVGVLLLARYPYRQRVTGVSFFAPVPLQGYLAHKKLALPLGPP